MLSDGREDVWESRTFFPIEDTEDIHGGSAIHAPLLTGRGESSDGAGWLVPLPGVLLPVPWGDIMFSRRALWG